MSGTLVLYGGLQVGLVGWAADWWIHRRDEIPLLVTGFFLLCGSFRAVMLAMGFAQPVNLGLEIFAPVEAGPSLEALWLILLGQAALLASYCQSQGLVLPGRLHGFEPAQRTFLIRAVSLLFAAILPLAILARTYVSEQSSMGKSLAFEVSSYAILAPMALVGVAIMVLCMWRFNMFTTVFQKAFAAAMLAGIAWFTFSPSLRFLFLGWVLAGGVVWSATAQAGRRWMGFVLGGVLAVALFGVAGAMRYTESGEQISRSAIERITSAEDANMLDGFVMLRQVFPEMLPYSHGREHLNILLRPIPRVLWPEKPAGGYMNRLGMFDAGSGGTTGISPTLFGSFYQEGGAPGVILLSILYGWVLGRVVVWTTSLTAFASLVARACVFAGLVPLMRAGDLAGVYAWLGMSFWPCALVIYWLQRSIHQMGQIRTPFRRNLPNKARVFPLHERRNSIRKLRPVSRRPFSRRRQMAERPRD